MPIPATGGICKTSQIVTIGSNILTRQSIINAYLAIQNLRNRPTKWRRKLLIKQFARSEGRFVGYPELGFVFQTHNKAHLIRKVLKPFIHQCNPKHVVLFADACADNTHSKASALLTGPHHQIITKNNTHEIQNYRHAAALLNAAGCKYMVLLQDDDVYAGNINEWVDQVIRHFNSDNRIAIIGLNGAIDWDSTCYFNPADGGLTDATFKTAQSTKDGYASAYHELGRYQRLKVVMQEATSDASRYRYVLSVNRAPQAIRLSAAMQLGFFPEILEPYQYDDYFNCIKTWQSGLQVIHAPISGKKGNLGVGGMRLYNKVTIDNRPNHFVNNHNYIHQMISCDSVASIQSTINQLNSGGN